MAVEHFPYMVPIIMMYFHNVRQNITLRGLDRKYKIAN